MEWLKKKTVSLHFENRINILHTSFFDFNPPIEHYDLILAEGFLNIIGFEQDFLAILEMLRKGGYFIIHDEFKDHEAKCDYINVNHCTLTGTLYLDESVWWNDYYVQLENIINSLTIKRSKIYLNLIFRKLIIIKQIHPVSDPFIILLKEICNPTYSWPN